MLESGMKAKQLIEELKEEIDVALPIPDSYYVSWLNSVEQLLYSEIIKEQKCSEVIGGQGRYAFSEIPLSNLAEEAPVRFSDIYTVYADNVQLTKTNMATASLFNNVFFNDDDNLGIKTDLDDVDKIKIVYFVRPIPKSIDNGEISDETVKIPPEFIELIRSKIRGEAYKLANEDAIAAKWLNDYNILLETFKMWIANREARFGM